MSKSYGLGMGEAAASGILSKYDTLISGGAGDCIIIAAYSDVHKRIYMVHAHRKTILSDIADHINKYIKVNSPPGSVHVELASQIFALANANDSNLVNTVNQMLANQGYNVAARHGNTSLSLTTKGIFTPGANAASADRPASSESNAISTTSLYVLDTSMIPNSSGSSKAKESPF